MRVSTKSKLILMSVFCTVFAVAILRSAPWIIYSPFTERTRPASSANNYSHSLSLKHTRYNTSRGLEPSTSKQNKRKLVDILQLFSDVEPVYNISEQSKTRAILQILWYNRPSWFGEEEEECNTNINKCFQGNCIITYNRSLLEEADALIFDATASTFPQNPPLIALKGRRPNQIWIFYGLESPVHYRNNHFKRPEWISMFNWTMTYRLDSDIPHPYGILFTNPYPPDRNYSVIFRSKTKFAAWIVSHCNAESKRDDFVRLLQTYVPVDIFGNCGTNRCTRQGTECRDNIGKDYKFYLSFENSLCKDYITEKLFSFFPLDLITIQRGHSDYESFLPNDSYINSANFSTVQELANFMKRIAEDEDKFVRYLKSKDRYMLKSHRWIYCNALCNICKKLNNLEKYKRSYKDIDSWLDSNTCTSASDIR
ncbi:hypothetical protein CHS0354_003593 [Potamilus streckersoni]|uniref:Fucosyltransferase n=1 Tax=Potamilus streckersoni TaxID=2493646 RepID=A0AAE0RY69_9BIVA|nr:hypothetical protein CHS0354_003593 [Potamilus streckersoni]